MIFIHDVASIALSIIFPNSAYKSLSLINVNPYYQVNPTLWDYYATAGGGRRTQTPDEALDKHYHIMSINEKPWSQVNNPDRELSYSAYSDSAIMIISRNDGEDMDAWFDTEECFQ